jgi:hypothetical protein
VGLLRLLAGKLIDGFLKLEDLLLGSNQLLLERDRLPLDFEYQLRRNACGAHLGLVLLLPLDKVDTLLQLIEPPFNIDDPKLLILHGSS